MSIASEILCAVESGPPFKKSRRGYKLREMRGLRNHNAKLTYAQVSAIRAAHADGRGGYGVIARLFDCGESTVRDIVLKRTRIDA